MSERCDHKAEMTYHCQRELGHEGPHTFSPGYSQQELDDAKKEAAEALAMLHKYYAAQRQLSPCGRHPMWAWVEAHVVTDEDGTGLEPAYCSTCRDFARERAAVLLACDAILEAELNTSESFKPEPAMGARAVLKSAKEQVASLSTDDSRAALDALVAERVAAAEEAMLEEALRQWDPDKTSNEEFIAFVNRCPKGALARAIEAATKSKDAEIERLLIVARKLDGLQAATKELREALTWALENRSAGNDFHASKRNDDGGITHQSCTHCGEETLWNYPHHTECKHKANCPLIKARKALGTEERP